MPPGLTLDFQVAELGQRIDVPNLIENLYRDIVGKVDEADVVGIQVLPPYWPRRVEILCAHQTAKDSLLVTGLDVYGKHIELSEPGNSRVKVVIKGAPLETPNDKLRSWLEQFGTVLEFRNEHHVIGGNPTRWRTGVRFAYMINLAEAIPPMAKIPIDETEISVTIWHYGQTHRRCRWCKTMVPKDHECDRMPERKCFNCGSGDHMRNECPVGRCCYKCGQEGHVARLCPSEQVARNTHPVQTGNNSVTATEEKETSDTRRTTHASEASSLDLGGDSVVSTGDHDVEQIKVLVIGGSNCRDVQLQSDEQADIDQVLLMQGGLKIEIAHEKLEECREEVKKEAHVVALHVGSCNFPANSVQEQEANYAHYVELLGSVTTACPDAKIVVSSIPPRTGPGSANINGQILDFNQQLAKLAVVEDVITFCDNDLAFKDANNEIRTELYKKDGLHVNSTGNRRLSKSLSEAVKDAFFQGKLESDLIVY